MRLLVARVCLTQMIRDCKRNNRSSSIAFDFRQNYPNLSNKRDELLAERADFLSTRRFTGARYTSPEIQIRKRSKRDGNKALGETGQSRQRFFTCTQCIDCAQLSSATGCRRFFPFSPSSLFFFFLFFWPCISSSCWLRVRIHDRVYFTSTSGKLGTGRWEWSGAVSCTQFDSISLQSFFIRFLQFVSHHSMISTK